MSYETALAEANKLAACLRERGVTVSIELQKGATGGLWDRSTKKVGVMSHHTVSRRSQGLTPCLALVKRGRSDVPGPLCNGYGGYDRVYRIITMDIANHSGAGGPLEVPGYRIPLNQGRYYIWGTEYEGGLDEADWPAEFRDFMARSNAAILDYLNLATAAHMEHKTWAPKRKIDRLGYTTASGRAEVVAVRGIVGGVVPPITQPPVPPKPGASPWNGKSANAEFPNGSRVLRLYSAGSDVKFVQRIIGVKDDGWFGGDTVSALKKWQKARGLVDDGIVGVATWPKLFASQTTPAPSKPAPPARARIEEDGKWGRETTLELQRIFGTPLDGVISHQWKSTANENIYSAQFDKTKIGSTLGRKLQAHVGITGSAQDGLLGKDFVMALQRKMGTYVDGVIDAKSNVVLEMQKRLNAGTF